MHIIAIFLKMAKSIMKMNIVQLFIIATIILMWHQSITVVRHVCVCVSECVSVCLELWTLEVMLLMLMMLMMLVMFWCVKLYRAAHGNQP